MSIPFFSGIIIEVSRWIWEVLSPQSAEKIKLRCSLNKMEKQIEKDLANPNHSEAHKNELREKLGKISLKRIDSL